MIKATIHDIKFFDNFLSIINKFVQQCQFDLSTNEVNVYCKNPTNFSSARLLLKSDVITLNKNQKYDNVKICIRDVIAFKSAISIVEQIEEVASIELNLDTVTSGGDDEEVFVKSIKYNSTKGGKFNLITIDVDVIKDFISKDSTAKLKQNWKFSINPKNLDIAQNRTNNIVNLDEVSVYIYPDYEKNKAVVELSSRKSSSINSIAIPISNSFEGSLNGFGYNEIAIHESSFRILNILKANSNDELECFFNCDNNIFFITSKVELNGYFISSRLFVQMIKGK
jgi:hypothetical protein